MILVVMIKAKSLRRLFEEEVVVITFL